jgi:hypothetical protein
MRPVQYGVITRVRSRPYMPHRTACAATAEGGSDSGAPSSAQKGKALNTQFLGRFLAGVEQGNKRQIASNAARAAQAHLAAAGAASLRPALHKAAGRGIDAVNRVALTVAEQQKRTLCVSLLREVRSQTTHAAARSLDSMMSRPHGCGPLIGGPTTTAPRPRARKALSKELARASQGVALRHGAAQVATVFGYRLALTVEGLPLPQQEGGEDRPTTVELQVGSRLHGCRRGGVPRSTSAWPWVEGFWLSGMLLGVAST